MTTVIYEVCRCQIYQGEVKRINYYLLEDENGPYTSPATGKKYKKINAFAGLPLKGNLDGYDPFINRECVQCQMPDIHYLYKKWTITDNGLNIQCDKFNNFAEV